MLFQTFYSYNLLLIDNLCHSSFCRNQVLGPPKCQAELRGNFVWPAGDTPVYKVLNNICKIISNSNPVLLVVSSRIFRRCSQLLLRSGLWMLCETSTQEEEEVQDRCQQNLTQFVFPLQLWTRVCGHWVQLWACTTCTCFINTLPGLWKYHVNQGQEHNKMKASGSFSSRY